MILMGDEVRRTQRGNNNAYCQDNEISWFDWTLVEKHADVHRFVTLLERPPGPAGPRARAPARGLSELIQRGEQGLARREARPAGLERTRRTAWRSPRDSRARGHGCHVILNAYWEPLEFELPSSDRGIDGPWRRWIDTFLESPHDIVEWERAPVVSGRRYRAEPRSVVVLFAAAGRRGETTDSSVERRA